LNLEEQNLTMPLPKELERISSGRKILVVDDNIDAARLLAEALQIVGYHTRVAFDGPAALDVAAEFQPDAALIDLGLPVMDDYELCGHLIGASNGRRRPILMAVTGYGQVTDREQSEAAGFDAHIVKPVDMPALINFIDHYWRRSRHSNHFEGFAPRTPLHARSRGPRSPLRSRGLTRALVRHACGNYDRRDTNAASTDAARRVGNSTASVAAAIKIAAAPANAIGSSGDTPKNIVATMTRLATSTAPPPMTRPSAAGLKLSQISSRSRSRRCVPGHGYAWIMQDDFQLETSRLILRTPRLEDLDGWSDMMTDEVATRFIGGVAPRAICWRQLMTMIGAWHSVGFAMFSVIEKETGRWIGRLGPWQPEGWPGTEIGWAIARDRWGRGYAVEGAVAATNWAFDTLGWTNIIHSIAPDNLASQRVAQKLGSRHLGPGKMPPPYQNDRVDLWGQTREEWRQRRTQG
jgi:RimJ/RimL family protein N-acetyltransferase/CheY-like chemotaxis protein